MIRSSRSCSSLLLFTFPKVLTLVSPFGIIIYSNKFDSTRFEKNCLFASTSLPSRCLQRQKAAKRAISFRPLSLSKNPSQIFKDRIPHSYQIRQEPARASALRLRCSGELIVVATSEDRSS